MIIQFGAGLIIPLYGAEYPLMWGRLYFFAVGPSIREAEKRGHPSRMVIAQNQSKRILIFSEKLITVVHGRNSTVKDFSFFYFFCKPKVEYK